MGIYLSKDGISYLWSKIKNKFYIKPSTGIPKSDLASSVQTSIGKADTALQSHQDISGKVDNTATGADSLLSKITNSWTATPTDDTYFIRQDTSSKNEFGRVKFSTLWSYIKSKVESLGYTKNTGTITGIKMNGASKGTSGVVDLGTVITAHQDISGKQDKSTAVTHTANTAVGSATKPVYIAANGAATPITHSINSDVPANAKFTDTTYSDATQSAHGLMTAADKKKLDGIDLTRYLHYNAAGGMVTDTWYKFASFTCTQYYNYSTAIFAVGYSYTRLTMFRIVAGTAKGKPTAERIWLANITGDVANSIGYIISGNTINFFIKTTTGVYGYVGRLAASAETGDYIQQTDLVAATSAETTAIVPIGNFVTDISASNTAAKLSTAHKINTVAFDGTADITIPRSGLVMHEGSGTSGQTGYVRLATLKIVATYTNMPTVIRYINRGRMPVDVVIRFKNANTTDPELDFIEQTVELTNYGYQQSFLIKTGTSTWDFIVQKAEAYDGIRILDCQPAYGITVAFKNEQLSALPSGYKAATVYYRAMTTSTVANATTWNGLTQDCDTYNSGDTWLLVKAGNKIQHRLSYELVVKQAATLTETAWTAVPTAGATSMSINSLKYKKVGQMVYVLGDISFTANQSTGKLGTLPSGCRPSSNVYTAGWDGNKVSAFGIIVNTSGVISLQSPSNTAGWFDKNLTFHVSCNFVI